MAESEQAILDLVSMPAVRDAVLSPRATLLVSEPETAVVWANAAASQLFGSGAAAELLGDPAWAGPTFQRQLRDAARQIAGEPVVRGFRVSLAGRHEFIQGVLWRVGMPDGAKAIVFECPDERRIRRRREHELAEDTLPAFGHGAAAAILDEYGLPVAYTEAFAGIDIAPEKLEALGAKAGFAAGILRETVVDEAGAPHRVSLATLREEPGRHLVIITPQAAAAEEPDTAQPEKPPADEAVPGVAAMAAAAGLAVPLLHDGEQLLGHEGDPAGVAVDEAMSSAGPEQAEAPQPVALAEAPMASEPEAPATAGPDEAAVDAMPDAGMAEAPETGDWSVAEDEDADTPVEWHAQEETTGHDIADAPAEYAEAASSEALDALTPPSGPEANESPVAIVPLISADAATGYPETDEFVAPPADETVTAVAPAEESELEPVRHAPEESFAPVADEAAPPMDATQEDAASAGTADAPEPVAIAAPEPRRGGSIRALLERWYRPGTEEADATPAQSAGLEAENGPDAPEPAPDATWVADENAASAANGVFDFAEPPVAEVSPEAAAEPEPSSYEDSDARDAIERGASRPAWEGSSGYEPAQTDLDHTDDDVAPAAETPAAPTVMDAAGEPDADEAAWVETESGDAAPAPDAGSDLAPPDHDAERMTEPDPTAAQADDGSSALDALAAAAIDGLEPAHMADEQPDTGEVATSDPEPVFEAASDTPSGEPAEDAAPAVVMDEIDASRNFAEPEPQAPPPDWHEPPAGDDALISALPAIGFDAPPAKDAQQPAAESGFVFASRPDPVRFAWTVDQGHVFRSVSPELSDTLGPNAADVVGRAWGDVARVFGFDRNGDIGRLLEKRDTWSGKTVLWPVQGTDLAVPVDLAALPAFSGARQFDGFRGFGIIRTADAVVYPDEIGLALVDGPFEPRDRDGAAALAVPAEPHSAEPLAIEAEEDDFARALRQADDSGADDFAPAVLPANVVDLGASKRDRGEELSSREARAFREIGQRLGSEEASPLAAEAPAPEALPPQPAAEGFVTEPDQPLLPLADTPGAIEPEAPVATADAAPADEPATPEALLEDLPVPVLVYRTGETLYANPELLSITGHGSLPALVEAGGVDALFAGAGPSVGNDAAIRISRADGSRMEVRPVLRRVPWPGGRALLLAFRSPYQPEQADDRVAVDKARIEELKSILDTATDGIVITTPDGLVESLNGPAQALFGVSQESVAGKPLTDLFAPESHRTLSEYMREVAEPGIAGLLNDGREVIGREAKGGLIPMFVTIGRAGDAGKYCAVLRDITHWKKAEEELVTAKRAAETASEQKSEFLARVSHEIRTPLNAIIGFSDVMIEERFGPIDNERYRGYLRDINRSGVHVLDLINDLLDISKIEAGKMELTYEAVDLNLLVQETVALLQPQANSERIIIRTSLSRAVPRVVADARSIRQIILNLVSNAIKFTPANGQVIVSTVYEGNGEVVLRVRDTGRGMTEREIEHAMKPFHQINVTDERRGQGTGLGLPLTKALVEANRAYFDLESTPGEGTIAHVHFPTQRVLAD